MIPLIWQIKNLFWYARENLKRQELARIMIAITTLRLVIDDPIDHAFQQLIAICRVFCVPIGCEYGLYARDQLCTSINLMGTASQICECCIYLCNTLRKVIAPLSV